MQPPCHLLLPDPVCVSPLHPGEQRCQVTSAGSARLSQGASKANVKCHHNYKASASAPASPAPELLHQPCSRPNRPRRAGNSSRIPALVHALVSSEPQIPRALLNPASAGLDGKGEGYCRAAISISRASLVPFCLGARCFLKHMVLPCTLLPLKCSSGSLWSPPA